MELFELGRIPWLDTQLIYHALPRLNRPAVVICWPDRPYVCLGYSQDPARDLDPGYCRREGLGVFRRAVGGGTVYLDGRQLFFQIVLPRSAGLPYVDRLYRRCLAPVRAALGALGVGAEFRPAADLTVNGRKISGNGGGSLAGHPVVVGNILCDFDCERMSRVVRSPVPAFRRLFRERMRERLTTLRRELPAAPPLPDLSRRVVAAFGREFGPFRRGRLDAELEREMRAVTGEMGSLNWPESPAPVAGPGGQAREVKVAEGCYVRYRASPDASLSAVSVEEEGRLREVRFGGPAAMGRRAAWDALAGSLVGLEPAVDELRPVLAGAEVVRTADGLQPERVAELLAAGWRDERGPLV